MVRNTLKYVANKDMKSCAKVLKTVYTVPDEKTAISRLESVEGKWEKTYPRIFHYWKENWNIIFPIFKFSKKLGLFFTRRTQ